jgi:hypothetical protein
MNCICVQCFKRFEGRNIAQEFCSPECHNAFKAAERAWKTNQRQCLREGINHIPGSVPCRGGYQARNRGLSDGSDLT